MTERQTDTKNIAWSPTPTTQYREWTVGPLNWNLGVRACRITHLITIMAASQLLVLANENAELAGRSQ